MRDTNGIGEHWYAVQTRSNFEKKVAAQFASRGVNHYLPLRREMRQWKDRTKALDVPLFGGYIFARFKDSGTSRMSVLQTPGVARIVGRKQTEDLEAIPDAQIQAIQRLLASTLSWAPHSFLREGDVVRVVRGPLKGVEGLFVRHKTPNRLLLSVPLLSQSVATEMCSADVQPIHSVYNRAFSQQSQYQAHEGVA